MENNLQPLKNGFDDYLINENGEIFSLKNKKKRKIKAFLRNGYYYCFLYKDKKRKTFLLHRLLGYQFLGLTDDMFIDHIDGVKTNNSLSNLRVCTKRENNSFDNRKRFNALGFQCIEKNINGSYSVRMNTKFGRIRVGNQETIEDAKKIYFELIQHLDNEEYLIFVKERERKIFEDKLLLKKKPKCNSKFERFTKMILNKKGIKIHSFERMSFYTKNKEHISWRCKQENSSEYLYSNYSLEKILAIKEFEIINNKVIITNH